MKIGLDLYLRLPKFTVKPILPVSLKNILQKKTEMKIKELITEIKDFLNITFERIDLWFDKDEKLRQFKPTNNGWTIDQILEHIGLTNHFLLILIDKGTNKALANSSKLDIEVELKTYTFHRDKLTEVGLHKSFNWIRPEHMEPKSEKTLTEVRQ